MYACASVRIGEMRACYAVASLASIVSLSLSLGGCECFGRDCGSNRPHSSTPGVTLELKQCRSTRVRAINPLVRLMKRH